MAQVLMTPKSPHVLLALQCGSTTRQGQQSWERSSVGHEAQGDLEARGWCPHRWHIEAWSGPLSVASSPQPVVSHELRSYKGSLASVLLPSGVGVLVLDADRALTLTGNNSSLHPTLKASAASMWGLRQHSMGSDDN